MPSSATNDSPDLSPEARPVFNLLLAGFVTLNAGSWLYQTGGISLASVVAGFVGALLAVGPVASSAPGQRFGRWFRDIGGAARVGLMLAFGTGVVAATLAYDVSVLTQSAVFGSMVALDCYVVYRIVRHRTGG